MVKRNKNKKKFNDDSNSGFDDELEDIETYSAKLDKEDDRLSEIDSKRFREKTKHKREDSSTVEGVLDLSTSREVYKLQKQNYTKGLGGIISTGKESNVYYTKSNDISLTHVEELAVKIYRTRTLDFKKIKKYIEGDIRFSKIGGKSHQIIQTWALKEFKNLSRAFECGLAVPRPVIVRRNVLIMEFIGVNGVAAQQLRHYTSFENEDDAVNLYNQAVQFLSDLWKKVKLVHGDFSAYNILVQNDKLVTIDLGQGVLREHHLADGFLWRDIHNILYYFNDFDIGDEPERIFKEITGKEPIPEFLKL